MGQKSFSLKDAIIAMEIDKHKWLESEKAGRDIGFVAAAVDWLYKYSDSWQRYYGEKQFKESIFIERRGLRRFELGAYAKLISSEGLCLAKVINLSFAGLLCQSANYFKPGSKLRLHIGFGRQNEQSLSCIAQVERICFSSDAKKYEMFFKFDENIWQSLFSLDFLEKKSNSLE